MAGASRVHRAGTRAGVMGRALGRWLHIEKGRGASGVVGARAWGRGWGWGKWDRVGVRRQRGLGRPGGLAGEGAVSGARRGAGRVQRRPGDVEPGRGACRKGGACPGGAGKVIGRGLGAGRVVGVS